MNSVVEIVLVSLAIAVGAGFLLYATLGRLAGFHRPIRWQGGGRMNFAAEVAVSVFILGIGLSVLFQTHALLLPVLLAGLIGYLMQGQANRRFSEAERAQRERNARRHPGVFDGLPPDNLDSLNTDEVDLYDAGSGVYLGRVGKVDVRALIDRFAGLPEQGPNDIFFIEESFMMLDEAVVSDRLRQVLEAGLRCRDDLVLRWLPASPSETEETIRERGGLDFLEPRQDGGG